MIGVRNANPGALVQVEYVRDEHLTLASRGNCAEHRLQARTLGQDMLAPLILLAGAGDDDAVGIDDVDVIQVRSFFDDLRQILDDGIQV